MSESSFNNVLCVCFNICMSLWKGVNTTDFSVCCGIKVVSELGVISVVSRVFSPGSVSLDHIFQGCTWNLDDSDQRNHT
jgi:hypothetical protein